MSRERSCREREKTHLQTSEGEEKDGLVPPPPGKGSSLGAWEESLSHRTAFKQLCHVTATSCAQGDLTAPWSEQPALPWSIYSSLRNIKHHDRHKVPAAKGHPAAPWMEVVCIPKHVQSSPDSSKDLCSPSCITLLF